MTFEQQVAAYIGSEQLLSPSAKVIVGLSGGADSTALLAVLVSLGYQCVAVHCNFGLRGAEAEADMEHSLALAKCLGVECEVCRFNVKEYMAANGCSVEMACRDLRYARFDELMRRHDAEAVAVGHHMEDNVETFFLNLFRGTGIKGLRAMLPKRDNIVRPLLTQTRRAIEQYVSGLGLGFATDSTNALNVFKRNKIRNVLLPAIEEQFPGAVEAVSRTIDHLRADERLLNSLVEADTRPLEQASPELLRHKLAAMGFNASQCADIPRSAPGATFTSPTRRLTILPGGKYQLTGLDTPLQRPCLSGRVYPRPANFVPAPGVLYMDSSALANATWELRPWQPGDRIRPFGMKNGSKPVSDLLAAAGIASTARSGRYVLLRNDKIVWVVGVRASALFPVTDETTEIIEIRHEKI